LFSVEVLEAGASAENKIKNNDMEDIMADTTTSLRVERRGLPVMKILGFKPIHKINSRFLTDIFRVPSGDVETVKSLLAEERISCAKMYNK